MVNYTSIRIIDNTELNEAMSLVWKVFSEFEAPEYNDEGIQEFKDYIDVPRICQSIQNNELHVWGYYDNQKIAGIIAMRPPCHISLLFVDKEYHKKGIARALVETAIQYYTDRRYCKEITVNSSPYAHEVYHKLGFVDTDTEQTVNGIRFIPMRKSLNY